MSDSEVERERRGPPLQFFESLSNVDLASVSSLPRGNPAVGHFVPPRYVTSPSGKRLYLAVLEDDLIWRGARASENGAWRDAWRES